MGVTVVHNCKATATTKTEKTSIIPQAPCALLQPIPLATTDLPSVILEFYSFSNLIFYFIRIQAPGGRAHFHAQPLPKWARELPWEFMPLLENEGGHPRPHPPHRVGVSSEEQQGAEKALWMTKPSVASHLGLRGSVPGSQWVQTRPHSCLWL